MCFFVESSELVDQPAQSFEQEQEGNDQQFNGMSVVVHGSIRKEIEGVHANKFESLFRDQFGDHA